MKLSIEEIALIVQALKGENGREKQRHLEMGLSVHGRTKKAVDYTNERMSESNAVQKRTALIEKMQAWQVQVEIGQKGGKK